MLVVAALLVLLGVAHVQGQACVFTDCTDCTSTAGCLWCYDASTTGGYSSTGMCTPSSGESCNMLGYDYQATTTASCPADCFDYTSCSDCTPYNCAWCSSYPTANSQSEDVGTCIGQAQSCSGGQAYRTSYSSQCYDTYNNNNSIATLIVSIVPPIGFIVMLAVLITVACCLLQRRRRMILQQQQMAMRAMAAQGVPATVVISNQTYPGQQQQQQPQQAYVYPPMGSPPPPAGGAQGQEQGQPMQYPMYYPTYYAPPPDPSQQLPTGVTPPSYDNIGSNSTPVNVTGPQPPPSPVVRK